MTGTKRVGRILLILAVASLAQTADSQETAGGLSAMAQLRGAAAGFGVPLPGQELAPVEVGAQTLAATKSATSKRKYKYPATRIYINGVAELVAFNDGDSFRVLTGPFKGARARLTGFNSLESYGPVHSWGDWDPADLLKNTNAATENARRGYWHCETDEGRDRYGRILCDCRDLSVDQIRRGLAHAYSATKEPAAPYLLRAQREAIKNKRGMWARGVPEYLLTSVHSADEPSCRGKWCYNRLISTKDGHSVKWLHKEKYGECETVCVPETPVKQAAIDRIASDLREDTAVARLMRDIEERTLRRAVTDFARIGQFSGMPDDAGAALGAKLTAYREKGAFGASDPGDGSCLIYVKYKRRYGRNRAQCLK